MLWMAVTADRFELPLAVADNARSPANIMGAKTSQIEKAWYNMTSFLYMEKQTRTISSRENAGRPDAKACIKKVASVAYTVLRMVPL